MKPIVYFFGSLPGGLCAYPQDHTKLFFEDFIKRSKNVLQIVVHRMDNLLYYGYVRKFNGNYFGICVCLDRIYNDVGLLFNIFDDIFAQSLQQGEILKFSSENRIDWALKTFASENVAINEYTRKIIERLNLSDSNSIEVPPADFSISINDCIEISLESSKEEILNVTKRYSNIYIVKTNDEIERVTGFTRLIEGKDKEISRLKQEVSSQKIKNLELSSQLIKAKALQKNMVWVSVLSIITFIFGTILWNKVLFPSEVTHYKTKDFIYYGPLKNKKPHGIGVAFYPQDDVDGRKFYIGNFENGVRQDSTAMLYYREGDYFYGKMKDDKWENGLLYKCSDGTYFRGSFQENIPYNGVWYDHVKRYKSVEGEIVY